MAWFVRATGTIACHSCRLSCAQRNQRHAEPMHTSHMDKTPHPKENNICLNYQKTT